MNFKIIIEPIMMQYKLRLVDGSTMTVVAFSEAQAIRIAEDKIKRDADELIRKNNRWNWLRKLFS